MENTQKRWLTILLQIPAILVVPLCVLYFEVLFSVLLDYSVTIYTIGFSLAAAALLLTLSFAFKHVKIHFVLQAIFLSFLSLLYIAQYLYNRIFQTLFIAQSLKGAGKALAFADVLYGKMRENILQIILFLLPVILFFIFGNRIQKNLRYSFKLPLLCLAVSLAVGGGTIAFVLYDKGGALSPRYLFLNSFVQDKSLNRFGLLTTMNLDIKYNVLNLQSNEDVDFDVDNIIIIEKSTGAEASEPIADGSDSGSETGVGTLPGDSSQTGSDSAPAATTAPTPTEPEVIVYEPNIMDITFDLAAEDADLLAMNQYYAAKEPTLTNEYTGLFKGKNLILLTAEGFTGYVIDPVLTPTLYRMSTEGFVFNNFYTPVWGVSTSDSEYVATTGLIPKAGVWSYTEISDNLMPLAFGNQFSALGYVTKAYHDHTYTYYNRDKSYPAMGYDYKGVGNGLAVNVTWPESDLEMMELTVPEYIHDTPFHVYYMTVSGHLEYNFGGNFISKKNRDLVVDLPYSSSVQAYLACQVELDLALENLLSQLEAAGQLENTVIALSADHYPYGLEPEEFDELAGHDLENTFEMYKNAFILWSGDMEEPVIVDKYCSSLDIAPTLSNLFGLEYDSRLYTGTDILSTTSPVVVFQDRSFITDKIMYNANNQEVTKLTGDEITEDYIKASIQSVNDKFKYSAMIIEQDYYRYLFE